MAQRTVPTTPVDLVPKRLELTVGILGIVVGLAGIYLTVLTFPAALDAVGSVLSGTGLPAGFKGLAGGLTLFVVILIAVIALGALFVGLLCLSEMVYHFLAVPHARVFGVVTAMVFFWASMVVTLLMYDAGAAIVAGYISAIVVVPSSAAMIGAAVSNAGSR